MAPSAVSPEPRQDGNGVTKKSHETLDRVKRNELKEDAIADKLGSPDV
jgi:hypothetical protein